MGSSLAFGIFITVAVAAFIVSLVALDRASRRIERDLDEEALEAANKLVQEVTEDLKANSAVLTRAISVLQNHEKGVKR